MAADATTYLLQSLGLRVRAPSADADPRRARGVKRSVILGKSWELRVKGWRHGARQKRMSLVIFFTEKLSILLQ